jgi:hypothetical protein
MPEISKTNEDNKAAEAVAEQLRHEISGISVSIYERTGKAVLRAYVRTREQANAVQRIVNQSTVPVFSEIVSLQEVENSAEMMASMKGFTVDVTFAKDGTAYWTGYLPAKADWKTILARLEVDLPFIKENVCNITFSSDIEQRAKVLAKEAGIRTTLVFDAKPREIIISGALPESLCDTWGGVFAKLKSEFGSIVTLTNDVGSGKAVTVEGNPFHSEIVGVTLDQFLQWFCSTASASTKGLSWEMAPRWNPFPRISSSLMAHKVNAKFRSLSARGRRILSKLIKKFSCPPEEFSSLSICALRKPPTNSMDRTGRPSFRS